MMYYTLYSVDCEVKALSFSQSLLAVLHFKPYPNKILKHFSHFFKLCNLRHFCLWWSVLTEIANMNLICNWWSVKIKKRTVGVAWNSSDCFESFSPLNTEGVITTRSNWMKFRLQWVNILMGYITYIYEPVNGLFNCDFLCSTEGHCVLENIVVVLLLFFISFA